MRIAHREDGQGDGISKQGDKAAFIKQIGNCFSLQAIVFLLNVDIATHHNALVLNEILHLSSCGLHLSNWIADMDVASSCDDPRISVCFLDISPQG